MTLVEQLAEAIADALNDEMAKDDPIFDHTIPTKADDWTDVALALKPVVAAQVEAAVSVVRAEVERANQHADEWAATADRWTHRAAENGRRAGSAEADLRALREGLEALADEVRFPTVGSPYGDGWNAACDEIGSRVRALLAPSPPEGTGEADCGCGDKICADCGYCRGSLAHCSAPKGGE